MAECDLLASQAGLENWPSQEIAGGPGSDPKRLGRTNTDAGKIVSSRSKINFLILRSFSIPLETDIGNGQEEGNRVLATLMARPSSQRDPESTVSGFWGITGKMRLMLEALGYVPTASLSRSSA